MRPSLNCERSTRPLVPPPTVYEGADTCESVKIQKRWILDAPTGVFAAAVLLVAAIVFAYANSFSGVSLFDDDGFITENASIEHLATAFSPPPKATVSDRSLLNLSFAVNYPLGGSNLWGYHLGNLLIHACTALAFLGIVRRMLLVPTFRERYGARGTGLALVIALLWALHPLQTGSFTYSIQQAESSMGMLYLLTLYLFLLFLRAMVSPRQDALAAAMTDVVFTNYRLFGRKGLLVLGTASIAFGAITCNRNEDDHSALRLSSDTIRKRPHNARAHNILGNVYAAVPGLLLAKGKSRTGDALAHFEAALRIGPDLEQAHRMIEKLSAR